MNTSSRSLLGFGGRSDGEPVEERLERGLVDLHVPRVALDASRDPEHPAIQTLVELSLIHI